MPMLLPKLLGRIARSEERLGLRTAISPIGRCAHAHPVGHVESLVLTSRATQGAPLAKGGELARAASPLHSLAGRSPLEQAIQGFLAGNGTAAIGDALPCLTGFREVLRALEFAEDHLDLRRPDHCALIKNILDRAERMAKTTENRTDLKAWRRSIEIKCRLFVAATSPTRAKFENAFGELVRLAPVFKETPFGHEIAWRRAVERAGDSVESLADAEKVQAFAALAVTALDGVAEPHILAPHVRLLKEANNRVESFTPGSWRDWWRRMTSAPPVPAK